MAICTRRYPKVVASPKLRYRTRCDAILEQAEDYLQRPVLCIASDDPRLKDSSVAPDAKP